MEINVCVALIFQKSVLGVELEGIGKQILANRLVRKNYLVDHK
jgi:hypothetical protein